MSARQAKPSEFKSLLVIAGLFDGRRNGEKKEIWPVYRTSPYRAEAERLAGGSSIAQILFVDEGQQCRYILQCVCNCY